ncbi:hypothetical protein RB653_010174 [Dictyostelium firmibasis]|uniref:Major facilitator superfamily (MFS) profile domain-containing protein n=1 Tax=Dictyostelium firmibasis TaxID=79012 RepID=A0AAN7TYW7_9MYCE
MSYKKINVSYEDEEENKIGEEPILPILTEEQKKKQNLSINIMVLTVFLQSIGFTLILPSMLNYLHTNDPQYDQYFGYIVASYSLGQFLGSPLFGKWSNKRPASEPVVVSIAISIIGSIFYSICYKFQGFGFPAIMGAARFVVGFGAGNVSVCRAYATETATIENKTQIMGKMSGAQGAGFVLGPGIGFLLNFSNFSIGQMVVNKYTAPGYLSIILAILNIILVLVLFKDARDLEKRNLKTPETTGLLSINNDNSSNKEQKLKPIVLSIFLFMVVITIFAVFETVLTLMTLQYYNWGSTENYIILGSSGIISVAIFIAISSPVIKKFDDRKTALFGFTSLLIALVLLINYNIPIGSRMILPKWQFFIGSVFVSIGYPIASSLVYAIFSKVLNPNSHTQGTKMGWLTAGGSLARMVGPLWSQEIWTATHQQGMELFFVTAVITLIAIIVFIVFYKDLSPHPEFVLQQNSITSDKNTTSKVDSSNNN